MQNAYDWWVLSIHSNIFNSNYKISLDEELNENNTYKQYCTEVRKIGKNIAPGKIEFVYNS